MSNLDVYIAQVEQYWEDKKANFKHLEKLFSQTDFAENGLVILPEMFNTGFSTEPEKNAEMWGSSPSIEWLKRLTKKYKIALITSLIIEEEGDYFNRLVFVDQGTIKGHYNKNYLFSLAGENKKFRAGETKQIFHYQDWKILPLICYDLRFPELSRIHLVEEKPSYEIIVYVANWPEKRIKHWNKLLEARAIENLAYCVGVNRTGSDGNNIQYNGNSKVISPMGEITAEVPVNQEEIAHLQIDLKTVVETRERFGFLNDIK